MNKPLHVLLLCLHGAVPCLLIYKQGDMGSALVFFFIFLCMIFTAGLQWRYILAGVGAMGVLVPVIWFSGSFPDYLKNRIRVLGDVEHSTLAEADLYKRQISRSFDCYNVGMLSEKGRSGLS